MCYSLVYQFSCVRNKILAIQIKLIKVMITETKKLADTANEVSLFVSFSLTVLVSSRVRSPRRKIVQ